MRDLVCDVINYYASSCVMGKTKYYDQIIIEPRREEMYIKEMVT